RNEEPRFSVLPPPRMVNCHGVGGPRRVRPRPTTAWRNTLPHGTTAGPAGSVGSGGGAMVPNFGKSHARGGFCEGLSRRDFLTVGGSLVAGGLSLPRLLAAEAQSGVGSSHRAVINVFLPGGPPHIDMWDLKPDAPAEIRGEFKPIKTNVP